MEQITRNLASTEEIKFSWDCKLIRRRPRKIRQFFMDKWHPTEKTIELVFCKKGSALKELVFLLREKIHPFDTYRFYGNVMP